METEVYFGSPKVASGSLSLVLDSTCDVVAGTGAGEMRLQGGHCLGETFSQTQSMALK